MNIEKILLGKKGSKVKKSKEHHYVLKVKT